MKYDRGFTKSSSNIPTGATRKDGVFHPIDNVKVYLCQEHCIAIKIEYDNKGKVELWERAPFSSFGDGTHTGCLFDKKLCKPETLTFDQLKKLL